MIAVLLALTLSQAPLDCDYQDFQCRLRNLEEASVTHMSREEYLTRREVIYGAEAVETKKLSDAELLERIIYGLGLLTALVGKDGVKYILRRAGGAANGGTNGHTN